MPAAILLDGVLVGLAIAMVVVAVAPFRSKAGGIASATAVIEQRYAQHFDTGEEGPAPAAPPWLAGIGRRLSPAGTVAKLQRRLDIAGNPERCSSGCTISRWRSRPSGSAAWPGSSCPTCCCTTRASSGS